MKTIVLSDLHIGDPRAVDQFPKIIRLLNTDFDRLILNGDIFDLWFEDNPNVLAGFAITRKLIEVAKNKQVCWVRGNHDYETNKISCLLPVLTVNKIEITCGSNKILIMHGHQVYRGENRAWYSRWLAKINLWLEKTFNIDLQQKTQKCCYYQNKVRDKRREIIKRYGEGFDYVISGHTHLIGYSYYGGTELYDAGSTVFTNSYVEIKDGHICLRKI